MIQGGHGDCEGMGACALVPRHVDAAQASPCLSEVASTFISMIRCPQRSLLDGNRADTMLAVDDDLVLCGKRQHVNARRIYCKTTFHPSLVLK